LGRGGWILNVWWSKNGSVEVNDQQVGLAAMKGDLRASVGKKGNCEEAALNISGKGTGPVAWNETGIENKSGNPCRQGGGDRQRSDARHSHRSV